MYTPTQHLYLKPADRVVIPKSVLNLVQHHGIYIGHDEFGQHWFAENHHLSGVRLVPAEQFLRGISEVTRVQRFIGCEQQRRNAVNFAMSMVGRPYDLLTYNCEHYSNQVQHGKPDSDQVKAGFVVTGLLLAMFGGIAALR